MRVVTTQTFFVIGPWNRGFLLACDLIPFDVYYSGIIGNLILFAVGYALGHRSKKSRSIGRNSLKQ